MLNVGECVRFDAAGAVSIALASPKSSTFTVPSGRDLDVRGFEIAMNDPLFMRRFERLRDLLRDRQRLVDRDRPARNALRQVLALDELHHQRTDTVGFFETVDVRDVGMIQRREGLRFAREPREPFGVAREDIGQHLDRDVAIQLRIARAIDLAHAAGAQGGEDLIRAEAKAGVEGQTVAVEYMGHRRGARMLYPIAQGQEPSCKPLTTYTQDRSM